MSFKNLLYKLFLNALIFSFIVTVVRGAVLPVGALYLVSTLLLAAGAMMLHAPILRFLTIKINFLTQFIMTALLVFVMLNLLETFMPEFRLMSYVLPSQNLQIITISSITLTKAASAGLIGIATGLLSALMKWMKE